MRSDRPSPSLDHGQPAGPATPRSRRALAASKVCWRRWSGPPTSVRQRLRRDGKHRQPAGRRSRRSGPGGGGERRRGQRRVPQRAGRHVRRCPPRRGAGRTVAGRAAGRRPRRPGAEETMELFSPPRRTLTIRAAPLVEHNGVLGAVAIIEDISEKRRLEAVRRDFVANICHELKTPVGALSLVAETLEGEDDPEVVARLSHRMRAEAERLGRIIEDLLDLSRIEAEESTRAASRCRSQVVIAEATGPPGARRRASRDPPRRGRAAVRRRRHRGPASAGLGRPQPGRQRHQVLRGRVDGPVVVRPGGGADRDRPWRTTASASRPGISNGSSSASTGSTGPAHATPAGTGLGLAIVRHVAGNHGGEVRVESREGEGSTFVLVFPAEPEVGARRSPSVPRPGREITGG